MATTTTKKNGPPAKERPAGRPSPTPSTTQNPRARTSRPSSPATSEESVARSSPGKKPTPNYLKPTFCSSPDAAKLSKAAATSGTTKASGQKSITGKKDPEEIQNPSEIRRKSVGKPQPQRSSSFNPPRGQKPALASRPSFSERTAPAKGKSTSGSLSRLKVGRDPGKRPAGGGRPRSKCSSTTSSANVSPKGAAEETMSNEDREAALDILNLDVEEHVLLEIPPSTVVDKAALLPDEEAPAHEEEHSVAEEESPLAAEAFVEEDHVLEPVEPYAEEGGSGHEQPPQENESEHGDEAGKKEDDGEATEEKGNGEVPTTDEVVEKEDADQKSEEEEEEEEEKAVVDVLAAPEPDGEVEVAKVKCDGGEEKEEDGADGGGGAEEKEAAPAKEKRREAAPAYNDVIEETASKLVGKRKSKVKALVGAFETVIVMDSGGQAP